jgi:tRNA threonylcarbamoyladenosine biosynthesis protein TsaB
MQQANCRARMSEPRTILALDASAAACSVALWRAGSIAAHRFRAMARGHAEVLMPLAVEVLAEAGIGFDNLDGVAVTVGPGAFTGLRIALAAARGIALAAGIPVIGVTTFAAIAEAVPPAERADRSLLVLLDSKRGDLFAQLFAPDLLPIGEPGIVAPAAITRLMPMGPVVLAGDGLALLGTHLAASGRQIAVSTVQGPPDAAAVARLAVRLARSGRGLPPIPLYLRPPDARLPQERDEQRGRDHASPSAKRIG